MDSKQPRLIDTEQQRQAFIDKYVAGDENASALHTQRYKGLGEMNPAHHSTMPRMRKST